MKVVRKGPVVTIMLLGLSAFFLCLVLTPFCRDLAVRYRLVDHPDLDRKFHTLAVPRLGGVPIVISYGASLVMVFLFGGFKNHFQTLHRDLLWSLFPALGIVFCTGLIDDLKGLKPYQKVFGQVLGAGVATALGIRIHQSDSTFFLHHPALATPWISIPLSILWLIGCTNAVNLIDGLDGLAAGVGLFATITTLLAAIFTGNTGLVLVTMPLAGCLLAFLRYNFSPASIFLGDSGSLTIGFVLGCFGLLWGSHGGTMLGMAAPLMAFVLPILDVGLAICRRYLRRVPIFQGDRGHIHHMVLARGFKTRDTALILYCVCAVGATLGLIQSYNPRRLHGAVIGVFTLLVWAGVRYLGYIELGAAGRAFSRRRLLGHVRDEIYLHELDRSLQNAQTLDACWMVVSKICADLSFATVEMSVDGRHYKMAFVPNDAEFPWKMTVPLGLNGHLKLCRTTSEVVPKLLMESIEHLQNRFKVHDSTTVQSYAHLTDAA